MCEFSSLLVRTFSITRLPVCTRLCTLTLEKAVDYRQSPCHCIIGRQRKKEKNTAIIVLCIAWNLFCFWCFHFNIFSVAVHSLIHSYVYNLHARGTSRQILFLICFYIFKRLWLAWFWQVTDWALSNAVGREVGWYSKTREFPTGSPFPPSSPVPSPRFLRANRISKTNLFDFNPTGEPASRLI